MAIRPLRVFFDVTSLLDGAGGIPFYTRALLRELLGRPDEVELVAGFAGLRPRNVRAMESALASLGRPLRFSRARVPGIVGRALPRLTQRLAWPPLGPIDLVHATNFLPPPWPLHRRTVLMVHDLAFLVDPAWGTGSAALAERLPGAVGQAGAILTNSEFTKREVVARFRVPPERVFVSLLAPQWQTEDGNAPPPKTSADTKDDYLLAVGALVARKNYEGLLQAFEGLRQRIGGARLVVVGGRGPGSEPIVRRMERIPGVRWIERCSEAELRDLYVGARALAIVSWYEGFGIPVLEAMTCGCPVCHSTGSAMDEIVGGAGLAVPPDDPTAIAVGLEQLWNDSALRRQLATKGRKRARDFTWARAARATLAAYRHAAGR